MKFFDFSLAGVYVHLRLSSESSAERERREKTEYDRTHITFRGDFQSWQQAMDEATGYGSPVILDRAISATRAVRDGLAACERDTVLFDEPQVAHPLLAGLLNAATQCNNELRVMDFGGALGSSYRQNAPFLAHLDSLKWGVIEQDNFVKAGQAEFETDTLRFFPDIESCMDSLKPNFLLLSGVLQCLESPHAFLTHLLRYSLPFVFIDRTMAHRLGRDRLVIQRVPPKIYDASYPVWLLNADLLESTFAEAGYETIDRFDPHPGSTFGPPDFNAPYIGWFLRKKLQDSK
jgi:putative methyltransferase (TIGR04325 family)